jgi:hypothetical protein
MYVQSHTTVVVAYNYRLHKTKEMKKKSQINVFSQRFSCQMEKNIYIFGINLYSMGCSRADVKIDQAIPKEIKISFHVKFP